MVEAVETLTTDKAVRLFEKFGIFTRAELESREEILYETYAKTINIEALTMIDMAGRYPVYRFPGGHGNCGEGGRRTAPCAG